MNRLLRILTALGVLIVGVGVTIVATSSEDEHGKRKTLTIQVDGPDRDVVRDDKMVLNEQAADVVEDLEDDESYADVDEPLRGPDPAPVGLEPGAPLASQEWPGCKTAFVRSFSARTSAVKAIALHYTAGPNIAGWADLDGLTGYSNNLRNGVSWHFGIDREGHCSYNVPVNHKAWTISGLNSQTINVEGVGTGREPDYLSTAGYKKLSAVVRRAARLYNIPIRVGATDGHCNVTRKGFITHWMGGPCSGGHVDIRPYDLNRIVAAIARDAGQSGRPFTRAQLTSCRKLSWWRRTREPGKARRNAVLRRETLKRRGLGCSGGKLRRV